MTLPGHVMTLLGGGPVTSTGQFAVGAIGPPVTLLYALTASVAGGTHAHAVVSVAQTGLTLATKMTDKL